MTRIIGFLLLLTVIYFGYHAYILTHVSLFLAGHAERFLYYGLYVILVIWGLLARLLDNRALPRALDPLVVIGSFALPWIFYAGMFVFLYDVLYVLLHIVDQDYWLFSDGVQLWSFAAMHIFVAVWFIVGYRRARHPVAVPYVIDTTKPGDPIDKKKVIHIALLTDIHIGTLNQGRHTQRVISTTMRLKPDMILLAGDIFDGRMDVVVDRRLHLPLSGLSAPLGVYGCYGNHEYYGSPRTVAECMDEVGIPMLRDGGVVMGDFYVLGRDDRSVTQTAGRTREELSELVKRSPKDKHILLLDHQPSRLVQAEEAGVLLQVSGHTHNGQLWPLGWIVSILFEKNFGHHQRGDTHYVISPGVGTWGFPIKTSARSEIPYITLVYTQK